MGKIAKSEMMVGYFMIFRRRKQVIICFGTKKQPKKNMSRGMAVQQLWKDLQMPWKGLKKT
jgi:hypothetical protein